MRQGSTGGAVILRRTAKRSRLTSSATCRWTCKTCGPAGSPGDTGSVQWISIAKRAAPSVAVHLPHKILPAQVAGLGWNGRWEIEDNYLWGVMKATTVYLGDAARVVDEEEAAEEIP